MKCQRCERDEEVGYRVYSDVINLIVCRSCAEEARKLGISVEGLHVREKGEGVLNQGPQGAGEA